MDNEGFARVCRIFEAACDLDGRAAREAYLEVACAGDAALRSEVERMLAADAMAAGQGFLSPPVGAAFADPEDPLGVRTGEVMLGDYRVLRRIASGGMGTVYLAEQGSPRREVALKVLKPAFCTGLALRRFLVESEILARLRHPGIAEVYAAGVHAFAGDGLRFDMPWYAMEYLDGASHLLAYAEQRKLDVGQRFALFARVVDAVDHAHRMGVIHRDLKPGNILVDRDGLPRIIDFGIARALAPEDAVATLHTRTGELIGTLRYMAPEQIDGDATRIDVRADVYALGVILYELLARRPPHDIGGRSITDALRMVRDDEPPRLSRVDPALRGEPEWIVQRAIDKDPARRYGSAAALKEDVRRFLRHDALEAGPPSGFYRAQKFVRRHRLAVVALSAVFTALAGGLVATRLALVRARDAERNAVDEARVAKEVVNLFQSAFDAARDGQRGKELTVVDALDLAAADTSARLRDRPDLAARLHNRFAGLYASLGDFDKAMPRFEETLALLKTAGADATEDGIQVRCHLLSARRRVADFAGAKALLEEALTVARGLPAESIAHVLLAEQQGTLLLSQGRARDAEPFLLQAAEGLEQAYGADDFDALQAWGAVNVALQDQGRLKEAEPIARRVAETLTHLVGADNPMAVVARTNLAALLGEPAIAGYAEARDLLVDCLAARTRAVGADHPETLAIHSNLAMIRVRMKEYEAASADFDDILARAPLALGAAHPLTLQFTLAAARVCLVMGQVEKGERMSQLAIDAAGQSLPAENPVLAALHAVHGEALRLVGREREARAEIVAALAVLKAAYGPDGAEVRQAAIYLERMGPAD